MRRQHKTYDVPMKKWDAARLETEREIMKKFGLKNKRQLWKAKSMLRRFRTTAKELFSAEGAAAEKKKLELINKLVRYGFLTTGAKVDDVLPMTIEQVLGRQLQFVVKSKGLATSPKQARQLIVHGHIAVGDARVTRPSYLVSVEEETHVKYSPTSPVSMPGHPIRTMPKASLKSETEKALSEVQEKKIAIEGKEAKPKVDEKKDVKAEAKPKAETGQPEAARPREAKLRKEKEATAKEKKEETPKAEKKEAKAEKKPKAKKETEKKAVEETGQPEAARPREAKLRKEKKTPKAEEKPKVEKKENTAEPKEAKE